MHIAFPTSLRLIVQVFPLLLFNTELGAQEADVTFFVVGKHASYEQESLGGLRLVDYSFFSEVFLTGEGDLVEATLTPPNGPAMPFEDQRALAGNDRDNVFLVRGKRRYGSGSELQHDFPDGDYIVNIKAPSGDIANATVSFTGQGLPTPPKVRLSQGGHFVLPDQVDADEGLVVTWSPFSGGGPDSNSILDDLIFVIAKDCTGQKISHSGRPFESRSFLTYRAKDYRIPADLLRPGEAYTLQVEHAVLVDTGHFQGVPGLATYAVTTTVEFQTKGEPLDDRCTIASSEFTLPGIESQVVMLYYRSLEQPADFYGRRLGLTKTLDWDWIKFYQTSPTSYVGLVKQGENAFHRARARNSVMLSIATEQVDEWYERLRAEKGIKFVQELDDRGPIRSFLVRDPGNYTVEFFQWLQRP